MVGQCLPVNSFEGIKDTSIYFKKILQDTEFHKKL